MSSEQQASTQPLFCARGCGFYGSPNTLDMCSCYRQHCLNGAATRPSAAASTKAVVAATATVVTGAACFETSTGANNSAAEAAALDASSSSKNPEAAAAAEAEIKTAPKNRCAACKKKVGLTGFACRCGATYCGTHQYPEKHACGFDFKGAGRDALARANLLVKGEKLTEKIDRARAGSAC